GRYRWSAHRERVGLGPERGPATLVRCGSNRGVAGGRVGSWLGRSVVLVPPDSLDVVPGVGLMAEKALRNLRVFDARYGHRDHGKVLHVVARRGLVALGAIGREGGGVAKLGDGPRGGAVARRAVAPEQCAVRVLVRVAGVAIEDGLLRPDVRVGNG